MPARRLSCHDGGDGNRSTSPAAWNREFDAAIVISDDAAMLSGIDMAQYETREIAIRGSTRPHIIRVVPQGAAFRAEALVAA